MEATTDKPTSPQAPQIDSQNSVVPSNSSGLVDNALKIAERLEQLNKQSLETLKRQEELYAKQLLAGRAEGGSVAKTPEQIKQDEVKNQVDLILKMSGYKNR